jgi:hypothetical protein
MNNALFLCLVGSSLEICCRTDMTKHGPGLRPTTVEAQMAETSPAMTVDGSARHATRS